MSVRNPSHFTGKERDTESGNDYFGARYYASMTGRWLSPDWSAKIEPVPYAKLGDPQTLNLYAYAGNSPMVRIDLDGHFAGDHAFSDYFATEFQSAMNQAYQMDVAAAAAQRAQHYQEQNVPMQQLKYRTVGGSVESDPWSIRWGLTHNSKAGGWIVQHIQSYVPSLNEAFDYWEAWRVPAKSRFTVLHGDVPYDDMFSGPSGTHVAASARFYEGLTLPDSFTPFNRSTAAGWLPATTVNPLLPTGKATPPDNRVWTAP